MRYGTPSLTECHASDLALWLKAPTKLLNCTITAWEPQGAGLSTTLHEPSPGYMYMYNHVYAIGHVMSLHEGLTCMYMYTQVWVYVHLAAGLIS